METVAHSTAKAKVMQTFGACLEGRTLPFALNESLFNFDLPHTRMEDWKYTRTTRITNETWRPCTKLEATVSAPEIPHLNAEKIVFANGYLCKSQSNLQSNDYSVVEKPYDSLELEARHFFDAINMAAAPAIIEISVNANKSPERPLHIVHLTTEGMIASFPVIVFTVNTGADVHVVESFHGHQIEKTFTRRKLIVDVASNAGLTWDKIQIEGQNGFLMNDESVNLASDARFTINTLIVDGLWVRNELSIALDGSNVEANLNGFYLPRQSQFVDNHTVVDHRMPHSQSNELYKGILDDQSTGVFNGKVYVRQDAQKTNAFQSNANVLLSDDAQINSKPELEIYADDVKCSHGSTTGQMDPNAIFYLRSRGMSMEGAQRLLVSAFIYDVMNKVKSEAVRRYVESELAKRGLLTAE